MRFVTNIIRSSSSIIVFRVKQHNDLALKVRAN